MIETVIRDILRAHAPLLALVGGVPGRIDLVDVAEEVARPPYLTFNLTSGQQVGRGNLCSPASLGLLNSELLVTPWAGEAPDVMAVNTAARAALLAAQRHQVGGVVVVQSITFSRFGAWAREPETNLLTRGQIFVVSHTE